MKLARQNRQTATPFRAKDQRYRPTMGALNLIHEGIQALAWMSHNGMYVSLDNVNASIASVDELKAKAKSQLENTKVYKRWKRVNRNPNLGSRHQLKRVLHSYDLPTGTDEEHLMKIKDRFPFVSDYLAWQKLCKLESTYLQGIKRAAVNGLIHSNFNLHTTKTFRSSGTDPNLQNIPVRNKFIQSLVRSCFVSRFGDQGVILEADYKAIEVCIAACYHKDPTMLEYIRSGYDMHRDMAMECFILEADQVTKESRNFAKNKFVFPEFYGDYYCSVASALWDSISLFDLKTPSGTGLYEHLRSKGIKRLGACDPDKPTEVGTFEAHIQKVERNFWGTRFRKYDRWRRDWYNDYLRTGGFLTLTGFAFNGVYRRNEVINFPVQGSAFHCLLNAIIRLRKIIRKKGMRTVIICQIHDSIISDVPVDEVKEYAAIVRRVMEEEVPHEWRWIITPLTAELDVTAPGDSWLNKAPYKG